MTAQSKTTEKFIKQNTSLREGLLALEDALLDLTQGFQIMVNTVNKEFQTVKHKQEIVTETISALVELVGPEKVGELVARNRETQIAENSKATRANIERLKSESKYASAATVTEDSTVVFEEVETATGKLLGVVTVEVSQLVPDFKAKVMGQAVGFSVVADKATATISDILVRVPNTQPEAQPSVVVTEGE